MHDKTGSVSGPTNVIRSLLEGKVVLKGRNWIQMTPVSSTMVVVF